MSRIYVGNLPFSATEEELASLFEASGAVKVATIARIGNSRPRGFGFVEFEDASSVPVAVSALNGTEFKGRTLKVEAEAPKTDEQRAADREKRRAAAQARRAAAISAAQDGESKAELSMRVYVGNLPYTTTSAELGDLFSSCSGFVEATVADRNGEGSRGFGYVTFDSEDAIVAAVDRFNNTEHGGRTLTVERELPKAPRGARRRRTRGAGGAGAGADAGAGAGGAAGGNRRRKKAPKADEPTEPAEVIENDPKRVYVGNVPFSATEDSLRAAFAGCGEITEVAVPEQRTGHKLGFAYVTFATAAAATNAVQTLNETDMEGRTIRVELENRKPKKPRARRPRNNRRRRAPGGDDE